MNPRPLPMRRIVRDLARSVTACSALMLGFSIATGTNSAGAAAENAGAVQFLTPPGSPTPGVVIPSGGSATVFALTPPANAACPGGATDTPPYRWQTYLVAASVDVAALTYSTGPNPVGSSFVSPLYDSAGGNPVVNKNPSANPLGQITGIPTISFAAFGPGYVPQGDYTVGFACTTGGATVKYWSASIHIVTDTSDSPSQLTWQSFAPAATTTSTTGPSTTAAATSTTKPASTTTVKATSTTTVTSTTVSGSTTSVAATATTAAGTTSATFASGAGSGSGSGSGSNQSYGSGASLANTGTNTWPIVVWAIVLLVFGRIAVLAARPVRVRPPDQR